MFMECYYRPNIINIWFTEKNDSLNLLNFFKVSGCNQFILATFK